VIWWIFTAETRSGVTFIDLTLASHTEVNPGGVVRAWGCCIATLV
jgi:hypothetical protein